MARQFCYYFSWKTCVIVYIACWGSGSGSGLKVGIGGRDGWVGSGVGGRVDLVGLRAGHTIGIAMVLAMLALGDNPEDYPQRPQARGP